MRSFGYWLSVILLLLMGVAGLEGFVGDLNDVETLGQGVATFGQLTFGLAGIAAALGAILKKPWIGPVAMVFTVFAGLTAGMAPVVWGDAAIGTGVASGGLGLLIGVALYLGVTKTEPGKQEGDLPPPVDPH